METKWTSENIKKIEKFIDIRQRGYYCNGQQVTEVYNEVLGKNVTSTQCSSCIRHRIDELEKALRQFKETMQKEVEEKVDAKADSTDKGVEVENTKEVSKTVETDKPKTSRRKKK